MRNGPGLEQLAPLFGIQAAVYNPSSGQLFVSGPNGTGDTVCGKCKYSEVMDVINVTSAGVWKQLDRKNSKRKKLKLVQSVTNHPVSLRYENAPLTLIPHLNANFIPCD